MTKPLILALGCLFLTGCTTWVKLTPAGENVAVLTAADVTRCTRTGNLVVSVLDRVTGLDRPSAKVERDLNSLARNDAAERGADTVVPTSEVYSGKRNYDLYRCRPS